MGLLEEKILNPAKARVQGLYNRGVARGQSLFGPREGGAPWEGPLNTIASATHDSAVGIVSNPLEKAGNTAQLLGQDFSHASAAVTNVVKNPITGTLKAAPALLNEGIDAVTGTIGNIRRTIYDGIQGVFSRNVDRVAHYVNKIPVVGGIGEGAINLGNRVLNAPLEGIEWAANTLSKPLNGIIKWVRARTLGITEQAG